MSTISSKDIIISEVLIDTPFGQESLIENNNLLYMSIYEGMFDTINISARLMVRDVTGWADEILLNTGNAKAFITCITPEGDRLELPNFYVYGVSSEELAEFTSGRKYVLDLVSEDAIISEYSIDHLSITDEDDEEKPFVGDVSELVEKVLSEGSFRSPTKEIEKTANKIVYKKTDGGYFPSIRKFSEIKPFALLEQLKENSVADENPSAANYVFYEDREGYVFKSIDKIIYDANSGDVTEFIGTPPVANSDEDVKGKRRFFDLVNDRVVNIMELKSSGAFVSTMNYKIPRPKLDTMKNYYYDDVKTLYYRVNCRFKDHFPAAIIGFLQECPEGDIESGVCPDGISKARWHYGFVEVMLYFDYEKKVPRFVVKPLDHGGVRSYVINKEDGPHYILPSGGGSHTSKLTYDVFGNPAFNTMEMGNDGMFNFNTEENGRQGWESPGYKLDTSLFEESCGKIQPIRGSFNYVLDDETHGSQVQEHLNDVFFGLGKSFIEGENGYGPIDFEDVSNAFPVVDMKIYYDQHGIPRYFFTQSNVIDGECDDREYNEDEPCLDFGADDLEKREGAKPSGIINYEPDGDDGGGPVPIP